MIVKLLTKRHLEFLSLKGGCTGSSESTLVKMSNCWDSRALAQIRLHCFRHKCPNLPSNLFIALPSGDSSTNDREYIG